jgi:hypothetical protein
VRLKFNDVVEHAQRVEIPEGSYHLIGNPEDHVPMVRRWRETLARQLLTPAPDAASVKWKQAMPATGEHEYTGVKSEHLKLVIANDLAFLAAHPVRRKNSEAIARRREFKEAMRRRIKDVAESRDLSDEEIQPALTLKHQEIVRFSEQPGVKNGCSRERVASS